MRLTVTYLEHSLAHGAHTTVLDGILGRRETSKTERVTPQRGGLPNYGCLARGSRRHLRSRSLEVQDRLTTHERKRLPYRRRARGRLTLVAKAEPKLKRLRNPCPRSIRLSSSEPAARGPVPQLMLACRVWLRGGDAGNSPWKSSWSWSSSSSSTMPGPPPVFP